MIRIPAAVAQTLCACVAATLMARAGLAGGAEYDVLVRGGRIADGTANPAFLADLGIRGGRIVALGRLVGTADITLDAQGLWVAPGFIDVHTHADDICELRAAENFVRMGVTTLVLGNCGSSEGDVAGLFACVDKEGAAVNIATLIGHGTVRAKVMGGSFMRPPTADELRLMAEKVESAMQAGAAGMSTGLIYLPGVFARTEELIALAKIVATHDGIYATHMRDEGPEIQQSLEEVFRIAREAHIRAEISHIKLSGRSSWNRATEVLATIDRARREGLEITQDQYVYTASSTGMSQLVPETAREGGLDRFKQRLGDPAEKARMVTEMKNGLKRRGFDDFAYAVIAHCEKNPALDGKNIVEATQAVKGTNTLDAQIDFLLELHAQGGAQGVFHSIGEDDLQLFLRHPHTMIASDSGIRKFQAGVPHPRGYGNNARVLARYVRELGLLRLEDAIRRMTSLPASAFRLRERGLIREGNWADLVVFDPATVQDHAKFTDPHHYAAGFTHVLVNGELVLRDGSPTAARPGRSLRHRVEK